MKNIHFYDVVLQAEYDFLVVYTEFRNKTFKGDGKLEKNLISHKKFIPQGSSIETEHDYRSYNLGVGYNILNNDRFKFIPVIELSANQFRYHYDAKTPTNLNVESTRKFGWGQVNVGFDSVYEFNKNYSLELNARYGIKHDGMKEYTRVELLNNYKITDNFGVLAGIEYEKFNHKDKQHPKQNYMKHELFPNFKIGLEYNF